MYYEMRSYYGIDEIIQEGNNCDYIVWEPDENKPATPINGRLHKFVRFEDREYTIPDGIKTICNEAFTMYEEWGRAWDTDIDKLIIPASVEMIEENAFAYAEIEEIETHSSSCIVKDNLILSGDGKTLMRRLSGYEAEYFEEADEYGITVPEGVERIAEGFFCCGIEDATVLKLPASVKSIADITDNPDYDDYTIIAPKGSRAIEIARGFGWEYIEE